MVDEQSTPTKNEVKCNLSITKVILIVRVRHSFPSTPLFSYSTAKKNKKQKNKQQPESTFFFF